MINSFFIVDTIVLKSNRNNKHLISTFICEKAKQFHITDQEEDLYIDFMNREAEFPTGLQDGFAIPHARTERVKKIAIMYLRTKQGIEWGTLDDKKVNYMFALLVPANYEGNIHLQMISTLATCLLEDDFKEKVKSSCDRAELKKYIQEKMEG